MTISQFRLAQGTKKTQKSNEGTKIKNGVRTIRDAIFTCAEKLTYVSTIYLSYETKN